MARCCHHATALTPPLLPDRDRYLGFGASEVDVRVGAAAAAAAAPVRYSVGQRVSAKWRSENGLSTFHPATVTAARPDGTYDLRYDDGISERRLPAGALRSADPSAAVLAPGARVSANFRGRGAYYPAHVRRLSVDAGEVVGYVLLYCCCCYTPH